MSAFNLTLNLNTSFTDLSAFADFAAKLRDLLAGFNQPVTIGTAAPAVVLRHPEPASVPEAAFAASVAPVSPPAEPLDTPAPAAPVEAPKARVGRPPKPKPETGAAVDAPVLPLEPVEAPKVDVAPAAPTTSEPAKVFTIEECRHRVLSLTAKAGKDGAKKLFAAFEKVGISKMGDLKAENSAAFMAAVEQVFAAEIAA